MKSTPWRWLVLLTLCSSFCTAAFAAAAAKPTTVSDLWNASWIAHPTDPELGYGVYRFRKTFELSEKPERFVVQVSGDRRYRLLINGTSVAVGPQRGDALRWHYETVDLAPHLRPGRNVLAATVWNYGAEHPYALHTVRTAFILQGAGESESVVNTDDSWRVKREDAYAALPVDHAALRTFIVVGPGDRVDGRRLAWGWSEADFDDAGWPHAAALGRGTPERMATDVSWWLAPRTLPLPFERQQRLAQVRRSEGAPVPENFLRGANPWRIPPRTVARVLLDQGFETNSYPELHVSGGKDALCRLTYAEALFDSAGRKGNRDEIDGRRIVGVQDEFVADGGAERVFRPLMFRTYRYLELTVETGDEPLTVLDLTGVATGYPFEERGQFSSDDSRLKTIWDVGVRTAQLCAYETYVDCPYYEQLQYVGDTRIQALISLYAFGDDRLMRNAIEQFDRSRLSFGLTQSRYPVTSAQIIPPFSLFWIGMVHDYWMHRDDDAFVRARLLGVHNVLAWFEERMDPATGLLGPLSYWNFVDWPDEWPWVDAARPGGQPAGIREGGSAIVSLQFAWALQQAAALADAYGQTAEATRWRDISARILAAVRQNCWDPQRKLFADTPDRDRFSQHVNALAVLTGAIGGPEATDLMRRVRDDATLTQCTLYFRFYLLRAAKQVGLGDDYLRALGPWHDMLARGLTTFAERPDPTRSDCHAWSASPVYELLATVCGIEPASPGFRRVTIEPHLGELRRVGGRVPHPAGPIEVNFERADDGLRAEIGLPPGISGTLLWRGETIELRPGAQTIQR